MVVPVRPFDGELDDVEGEAVDTGGDRGRVKERRPVALRRCLHATLFHRV